MSILQRTFPLRIDRSPGGPEVPLPRRTAVCCGGVLALLLALVSGCASPQPEARSAAPQPGGIPTPLLWRASRTGAGDLSLFGSVHMGRRADVRFGAAVAAAYSESEELVVEVNLSSLSPEDVAAQNAAHALLPPGRTLEDVLSREAYRLLAARLAERGTPMLAVAAMQPWAVASLLAVYEFQAAGYNVEDGVDRQLIDSADGAIPIRGLETLASQLAMMSGLSLRLQELMLLDMLTRTETVQREVADLMGAWSRGDEALLAKLLFAPLDENPELAEFYEVVFFDRNQVMAEQLAGLASDGRRRFVVLGAGHMVGPRGVPALLAERGFTVEKLQPR